MKLEITTRLRKGDRTVPRSCLGVMFKSEVFNAAIALKLVMHKQKWLYHNFTDLPWMIEEQLQVGPFMFGWNRKRDY